MILLKGQGILTRMTKRIVLQREISFGKFDIKALNDDRGGRSALSVSVKIISEPHRKSRKYHIRNIPLHISHYPV